MEEELEEGEIVDEEEEEYYEERGAVSWEIIGTLYGYYEDSNDTIINPHNPV
jgi:hypothetical protein